MALTTPKVEYLSTGANRDRAPADWSSDGLLAFGAGTNIALWKPESSRPEGIKAVLAGHTGAVNAITFLPAADDGHVSYLATAADDCTIRLWSISKDLSRYECIQTVEAHEKSITCLTALKTWSELGPVVLASGASDFSIKVWALRSKQLCHVQTIPTNKQPRSSFFPLTLALCAVGSDRCTYVLAAAGTRSIIQVFGTSSEGDLNFELRAVLSGHEDWIRSLDFTRETNDVKGTDILMASASQDKYIRIWRVREGEQRNHDTTTIANNPLHAAQAPGKVPTNKAYMFAGTDKDFSITFEALLLGHEDWVSAVRWHLSPSNVPQLLSASADNSVAIWEPDQASGIWTSTTRLGEISRDKGATTATGSIGGFWTALWRADGKSVVCVGRTGSWRRWDYGEEDCQWKPAIAVTGHTKPITGIAWSRNGSYLLSTSTDQTTRLHAAWTEHGGDGTWHEMSRPQIHGYDLNCIDSLGDSQFVSGADEKLLRVFREPRAVAKLLNKLCKADAANSDYEAMPDAANIPVLGLSNKAVDSAAEPHPDGEAPEETVSTATDALRSALEIDRPPFEDALSRYTLWPEIEKLYGHGYEISCLGASHDGKLVASACKASAATHAVIRLFETERWTEVRPPLVAHSLTAARVRFSPDNRFILSVGRDRQWAVFERNPEAGEHQFALLQSDPKGHSRMILDAAWAPEARAFVTAGRDKQAKVWRAEERDGGKTGFAMACAIPSGLPVTAVDFLPRTDKDGNFVLAVGDESGKVSICILSAKDLSIVSTDELETRFRPSKAVLQLSWRPTEGERGDGATLAIASEDTCLRLYRFVDL